MDLFDIALYGETEHPSDDPFTRYKAGLDQISNVTVGAALEPRWYADSVSRSLFDPSEYENPFSQYFDPVCSFTLLPENPYSRCRLHVTKVQLYMKVFYSSESEGRYNITYQKEGGPEKVIVEDGGIKTETYQLVTFNCDVWSDLNEPITINFYTKSDDNVVYSKDYTVFYGAVREWRWHPWYHQKVRTSFQASTLKVDNYQNSLYMGTVQAYIQGLEQGSIPDDCRFIDIRGKGRFFEEGGVLKYEQKVTYKALNGYYYTYTTLIEGDIWGTGPKDITFQVHRDMLPYGASIPWMVLGVNVINTVFYFSTKLGWYTLPGWVSPSLTIIKLSISNAIGKILTSFGWYVNTVNTPKTMPTVSQILGRLVDFGEINVGTVLGTIGSVTSIWLTFFGLGCALGGAGGLSGAKQYYFGGAFASFVTLALILGLYFGGAESVAAMLGLAALMGSGFGLVMVAIWLAVIGVICLAKLIWG